MLIAGETEALSIYATDLSAAGLAGVWATENTREALFDAMERKEVFGPTGSRIRFREFGGWDFTEEEVGLPDFAGPGYARGVPMGGHLRPMPEGAGGPGFLVRALRDPDDANHDRMNMIKAWVDADGETRARIRDIACADERALVDGRCDGYVGNTVNAADASYTNTIGDAVLGAHWTDPEFDPVQRAFH